MLVGVIEAISRARTLAFNFIVRLRRTTYFPADMPKLTFLDHPPSDANVTAYDQEHVGLYLRLLDAEAQRAPGRSGGSLELTSANGWAVIFAVMSSSYVFGFWSGYFGRAGWRVGA